MPVVRVKLACAHVPRSLCEVWVTIVGIIWRVGIRVVGISRRRRRIARERGRRAGGCVSVEILRRQKVVIVRMQRVRRRSKSRAKCST